MSDKKNVPKIRFPGFTEPWEQRKLGEYVEITSGEAPAKFQEGDINYVKVDDLNYAYKTVINTQNKVLKNSSVKMVQAGSVIFPKRGAAILTNKVRVLGVDSYMDTNMMALSSEKLDTNFLYTMLSKEGLYKIADTSTIPQINNKHIEPYKIYLPSMDEQLKIGIYFSNLDNLITLHQRKLEHVKKMKKSMLQKMFPKKNQLYPEVRFPGFTDAWEQRKLGEIATYRNGKAHEANQLDVGTYELVNLNSISIDGGLKPSGKFIEDGSDTLQRNDLVMVLSDVGHGDLLGRVAIIPENNRYVLNQRVALLRINDDTNTYFLFSIINRYQDYFKKLGAGSSQLNISRGIVENFEVAYPNVAEQRMIADYFQSLDHLITLHQRELDHLQLLKKGMLQQMFI